LKKQQVLIILTPLMLLIYWALNNYLQTFQHNLTSEFGLWGSITNNTKWIHQLSSAIIILVTAIIINYTFNHYNFFQKNTSIPAFTYVVTISFFENIDTINGLLLSNFLWVIVIFQFLRLNANEDGRKIIFNASFVSGIAISLFPSYIIMIPFLWLIVNIMRPFIVREQILMLCGLLLPITYAISINFIIGNYPPKFWNFNFEYKQNNIENELYIIAMFVGFVIVNLIGLYKQFNNSTIRFRQTSKVLLLFTVAILSMGMFHIWITNETNGLTSIVIFIALLSTFGNRGKILRYFFIFFISLISIFSVLKFFL